MTPDASGDETTHRRHGGSRDRDREKTRDRERHRDKPRERDDRRDRDDRRRDRRDEREKRSDRRERGDRNGKDGKDGKDDTDTRDRDRDRNRDGRRERGRDERRDERRDRRRSRSGSPRRRRRSRSHSPRRRDRRRSRSGSPRRHRSGRSEQEKRPARLDGPLPDQAAEFAQAEGLEPPSPPPPPKEKPNLGVTGVLAGESNAVTQLDGSVIALKYHEPPEARKASPRDQWKLFVFKDDAIVDTIDLWAASSWLVGREAAVADILAAHASVSGQHAVIQFRLVEKRNEFGDRIGRVKPYLLDLASANGTRLNGTPVEAQRFVELRDKDLLEFGHSTRQYILKLPPRELVHPVAP